MVVLVYQKAAGVDRNQFISGTQTRMMGWPNGELYTDREERLHHQRTLLGEATCQRRIAKV